MATQEMRRLTEQESRQLEFLSQTHRTLHSGRLKLEQTVVLTLLVFYAVFPGAVHQMGLDFAPYWLAILAVPLVFGGLYQVGIKSANDFNQNTARNAEERIHNDLVISGLGVFPPREPGGQVNPNKNRWIWNLGVVLLFAVGSMLLSYEIITRNRRGLTETLKIEAGLQKMGRELKQIQLQIREVELATAQHRDKIERLERVLARQRSTKSGRPK
jgi:hypothetical protein